MNEQKKKVIIEKLKELCEEMEGALDLGDVKNENKLTFTDETKYGLKVEVYEMKD